MWNKLIDTLQDPSIKRLGLALLISAVLHSVLLGGLDLRLPALKKDMHVIEARIQMPKAVAKKAESPKPEVPVDEPAPPKKQKKPKKETVTEPAKAPEEIVPEETPPAPAPETPAQPVIEPSVTSPAETAETEPAPPQPEDIGLVINPNAYSYVETYFDVSTKIDGPSEGKAKITYNLIEKKYQLKSEMEANGIVALFISDLLQTSEGNLTKDGLQPSAYLYQYGDKTDKTYKATFDWPNKKVTLETSKGIKTEEMPEGTQDLLSFMYQFMYVAPLERMQIPIATGKKLRIYDYSFEGEELVTGGLGEVRALRIQHTGEDSDEKTELWLALDYQYLPVKIRKIDKDGKVYEMVAKQIVTTRPTIDEPKAK